MPCSCTALAREKSGIAASTKIDGFAKDFLRVHQDLYQKNSRLLSHHKTGGYHEKNSFY